MFEPEDDHVMVRYGGNRKYESVFYCSPRYMMIMIGKNTIDMVYEYKGD